MFSDHDNPVTAAAAAPAHESRSEPVPTNRAGENPEGEADETPAAPEASAAEAQPEPGAPSGEAAPAGEPAVDPEAAAAAEEAASSEEMSKLLEQYDERSEERRVGKECRSRWSPAPIREKSQKKH